MNNGLPGPLTIPLSPLEITLTMKSTIYILLAVAMAALTASCGGDKKSGETQAEAEAAAMAKLPVDVAVSIEEPVTLTAEYPAELILKDAVDLVARVNGYLKAKLPQGGTHVNKGDVVFTIDDTEYREALRQANATLATAHAAYEYAKQQYAAVYEASLSDAVSKMEVIQAKANLDKAEAAIASAQSQKVTAEKTLSYCTVRAPMSGWLTSYSYSVGTYLAGAGGGVKVVQLVDDSVVYPTFSVEDARFMQMLEDLQKNGRSRLRNIPIEFSEPLPHQYTGDLCYIEPKVDMNTGTLKYQLEVQNPHHELRGGMYCTVKFPFGVDQNAVLVKDASISTDQRGKFLYTVDKRGIVQYTPVELGQTVHDTMRIVTKGLEPGQRYVTKALLKVRPGEKINARLVP